MDFLIPNSKIDDVITKLKLPFSWKAFIQKKEAEEIAFKPVKSRLFAKENGIDFLGLRLYQFFKNTLGTESLSLYLEEAFSLGLTIQMSQIEEMEEKEFYKKRLK